MSEGFNYEEVFMGVVVDKPKNYLRTFKEDYRLKRLTEAVTTKRGRMLDIGCGGGILTESLTHYFPRVAIYGCDISKTAITYAQKLGSGKVNYSVIKNKRLPYKSNFFDVCIVLDVMEHIPDVKFFLKEVKRILKRNGQLFLLVPCEGQPFTYTWLFQKIKFGNHLTFKHWGHIHPEFTHRSIIKLLETNGFVIKRRTYSEHVLWQIINVLIYFLPKELMELFIGKKASEYSDSGVIRTNKVKSNRELLMVIRDGWLKLNILLRSFTYWETDALKCIPLTAWKIHLLAEKNVDN